MNDPNCFCPEYDWGNWSQQWGGPKVTPYARAIIDHYNAAIPLYLTVPFNLQGDQTERRTILTAPQQYDCLLLGGSFTGFDEDSGDTGQGIYMNVSDARSKLPWVTASPVGWAPLTSYGIPPNQIASVLAMPEAYFLPRHTELQHDLSLFTNETATGGIFTWVGLQLINLTGTRGPENVTLINGKCVRVGARQPLWMPLLMGREVYIAGISSWAVLDGQNYIQYTEPLDCDAEIHSIASSDLFSEDGTPGNPDELLIKVTDMGDRDMWRPDRAPATAVVGNFTQINPALPLAVPYILKKGHRLQVSIQNNSGAGFNNMCITIRGVRLCEY